jgi:hypothetical protein
MPFKKGDPKIAGRKKGTPNKIPADLKEQILEAAKLVGGEEETVGYLKAVAVSHPQAFCGLLGKVLGITVQGPGQNGEHKYIIGWMDSE